MMDNIASDIKTTLYRSRLTARDLAAIANVHYTTIYLIQKKGADANPLPTVYSSIEQALDKLKELIESGELPFNNKLSQSERKSRLLGLVAKETI